MNNFTVIGQKQAFQIDYTNPKSVVEAIFYAAKTKDFSIMQCLCDPYGEGDGDVKELCAISKLALQTDDNENAKKVLDQFVTIFGSGKIVDEVTYGKYLKNQLAYVPFIFNHPLGKSRSKETMHLINRHGNWFLYSF
ncbi:hypothetical protein [Tenacibaculum agarivorans]|uniref:hypothetical protein n=1 Tax=Tenacibaculum agarivorans TaxID=1908389 RepID=UPI00094BBF06|nr:hypothetical protein [Tenacibaculum agarivorans]